MRRITYAGENVLTTDAVAGLLVELTAALAQRGEAAAVRIPIDPEGEAELVVGLGNDVLSVPVDWHGDDPDFDTEVLTEHLARIKPPRERHLHAVEQASPSEGYDPDFDITEA